MVIAQEVEALLPTTKKNIKKILQKIQFSHFLLFLLLFYLSLEIAIISEFLQMGSLDKLLPTLDIDEETIVRVRRR